jgi:hypothetical protein
MQIVPAGCLRWSFLHPGIQGIQVDGLLMMCWPACLQRPFLLPAGHDSRIRCRRPVAAALTGNRCDGPVSRVLRIVARDFRVILAGTPGCNLCNGKV